MSEQRPSKRPDGYTLRLKSDGRPPGPKTDVRPTFEQMQAEMTGRAASLRWNVRGGGGWHE